MAARGPNSKGSSPAPSDRRGLWMRRGMLVVILGAGLSAILWWGLAWMDTPGTVGGGLQLTLGKKVYDAQCAACHGVNLEGQPDWRRRLANGMLPAPPHDASGHTWHHPDRQLFDITKFGTEALAGPGYKSAMRGFGDVLTDTEIRASLVYIKSHWPKKIRARQAEISGRAGF